MWIEKFLPCRPLRKYKKKTKKNSLYFNRIDSQRFCMFYKVISGSNLPTLRIISLVELNDYQKINQYKFKFKTETTPIELNFFNLPFKLKQF